MGEKILRVPLYQADAFGLDPFVGNPAAVCLVDKFLPASVMQSIAAEMNLSETAFVEKTSTQSSTGNAFRTDPTFNLRWFTPEAESPLCGHATLASAAVLFQVLGNQQPELHFETLSGRLTVSQKPANGKPLLQMALPNCAPSAAPQWLQKATPALQAALGSPEVQEITINLTLKYVLVALVAGTSQKRFQEFQPDFIKLKSVFSQEQVTGVIVTCAGSGGSHHFLSRFFAPWVGINEDPVTGSAHAVSGPYWAAHLSDAPSEMKARQCSQRGGELLVTVNKGDERVLVSGQATIVSEGHLLLPASLLT